MQGRYLVAMSLTALGIVFGDIGTSPIYALRESFHAANGIDPTQANVLGVLSLILWSRRVVLLSVTTLDVPYVTEDDRVSVVEVADDLYKVIASYGFAESPDVPSILEGCAESGLTFDMMQTSFFLSSETFVVHEKGGMAQWRQRLFGRMSRNSLQPTAYFGIPPNRVVELGMQVQL